MPNSGRLRWTLMGLALLALGGGVLLSTARQGDVAPVPDREAAQSPDGPVLVGRADTGPPAMARTEVRADGIAGRLRVLGPDGRAAAGAVVSYRAFDRFRESLRGRTDAEGVLPLAPEVVGKRCEVEVEGGSEWSASRFDVWMEGEVTLRLEGGCRVWLDLGPEDERLAGQTLRYGSVHGNATATIASDRTPLGRYTGELHIYALGTTPADSTLHSLLLPPMGEVAVRWSSRPAPRSAAWLRVRGPAGSTATPKVTIGDAGNESEGWHEYARHPEPGALMLAVAPGRLSVLATADGLWAFRELEATVGEEPVDVPLTWTGGCTLEVRLPVEPSGDVHLSLGPMPGSEPGFMGWSESLSQMPGVLAFSQETTYYPAGEWPEAPRRPNATTRIWDGLPRGAEVHVHARTPRWGTLYAYATIPLEGDRTVLELPASTRFTVRGTANGVPDPDLWVERMSNDDYPERTRTVGGAVDVVGLASGTSIRLRLRGAEGTGEATVTAVDGADIRVPLTRRPMAAYRARVVDESGRPLARVGTSFGSDFDAHATVLTDADGWAEAVTASDRQVIASTAHPRLSSDRVPVPAGGGVTVVARRERSIHVVFDIGEQVVEVDQSQWGASGGGGAARTRQVFPGSTYTIDVRPDATHLRLIVRSLAPKASTVLFDRELELESRDDTTLRVTR